MEHVAEGWRGVVYRKQRGNQIYAEKRAKSPELKGALAKEAVILQNLARNRVMCVPAYIDSGDGWLESERREGEAFHEVREKSSATQRKKLAIALLDAVYQLDIHGVIHGELHRPMSNIRVEQKGHTYAITILDFERGTLGDNSGKNMRMFAQRLAQNKVLTIQELASLGKMGRNDIYLYISKRVMGSKSLGVFFAWTGLFIAIDLLVKYFLYDLGRGENFRILTPAFNTGSGWSIMIPWYASALLALVAVFCLIWAWRKDYMPFFAGVCIAAGALGNMYDRVLYHGVRDMFDLHMWPVFNVADMLLTAGCIIYIAWMIWPEFFRKISG